MSLAGLILSAGDSSRMGTPKALLEFQGETFLDRLIRILSTRCSPVIVVLGRDASKIRAGLRRPAEAVFTVNENHQLGQLSSLQCGLRIVPPETSGVLFTLVDHPAVNPATVAVLADHFELSGAPLIQPRFEGRRGHPICCSREVVAEFLALPPDSQARVVVHRYADRADYLDVDDPGVLLDIDDPAAYERLLQARLP